MFGSMQLGASRPAAMHNQSANRSATLGQKYQGFSNPFFDLAGTYTPPTVKALFAFCRHYFLTHGIINAIITKASEYPITDLILTHKDRPVKDRWEEMFNGVLNYKVHQFEINLEFFCYGNAFVSPSLPFTKVLKCRSCNRDHNALDVRSKWRYSAKGFWLSCPKCGQTDYAKVRDDYYPRVSDMGVVRWNPELVSTNYNEATGRTDYTLDFSGEFKNGVQMGRKDLVATTPQAILEAIKSQKTLVFDTASIFHMRRPGLSGMARWGIPLMMPVLKDAFYMQTMKKAQESVLLTHLVPQVFLFPQPATSGADPFCVSPETLVEVPGGVSPAAEIRAGDFLRSHTGAWRQVEDVVRRPVPSTEKVYKLTAYTLAGFPCVVSEDHPMLGSLNPQTRTGSRFDPTLVPEPTFIEAKKLRVGDFVAYPVKRPERAQVVLDLAPYAPERASTDEWIYARYQPQGAEIYEYFEAYGIPAFKSGPQRELEKFCEERGWDRKQYEAVRAAAKVNEAHRTPRFVTLDQPWARVLGYFLAEGHTSDNAVGFAFHENEQSFIAELLTALEALGYRASSYPVERNGVINVVVHDTLLAEILRNMCGRYAAQKHIPSAVSEASDELVFELLRCLFNGDGTVMIADAKGTPRVSLKTTSPHLALEARRLLLSLGYVGGVSRAVPREGEIAKAPYYQVYYNGAEGMRLAAALGWTVPGRPTVRPERNAFVRDGYLYMRLRYVEEAQEAEVIGFQMAVDHTFCVAGIATHNTTTSLADWRDHIRRELARQRMDSAYMGILPFPLGHQTIGENGKSLLLSPEIRDCAEMITIGMGFPPDLIFGNGTYAGSSVNMRMLENFFLSNMHAQLRLAHWLMKHYGSFLNWPTPDARFKAFRMADDLQRTALYLQLAQGGQISETTLLGQIDLKVEDEAQLRQAELIVKAESARKKAEVDAEVQGAASVIMAKFQAQANGALQAAQVRDSLARKSPFENAFSSDMNKQPGIALDDAAAALATAVKAMPPERQAAYMQFLQGSLPELGQLVQEQQGVGLPADPAAQDPSMGGGSDPAAAAMGNQEGSGAVDMRALPEQLPPRRAS